MVVADVGKDVQKKDVVSRNGVMPPWAKIAEMHKMVPDTIETKMSVYRNVENNGIRKSEEPISGLMAGAMDEVIITGQTPTGKVEVTAQMVGGKYVEVDGKKPETTHYVNECGRYRPAMAGDWEPRHQVMGTNGSTKMVSVPHEKAQESYEKKYGQGMPVTDVAI
ncbi:MAG: hypothetical protein ABIG39_04270 [Candidatus Micrarchaeota archaeon]